MKIYTFIKIVLLLSVALLVADQLEVEARNKVNVAKIELLDDRSPEAIFINKFWHEIVIKRGLPMSMNYFCSLDDYKNIPAVDDSPDSIKEDNYLYLKHLYHQDCSMIIDMLPKVHIDDIRLIRIETLPEPNPLLHAKGKIYKGVFTFANGPEKFEIIFPTLVEVNNNLKFTTRFWVPLKFTIG
jgi:hypothetical protein